MFEYFFFILNKTCKVIHAKQTKSQIDAQRATIAKLSPPSLLYVCMLPHFDPFAYALNTHTHTHSHRDTYTSTKLK